MFREDIFPFMTKTNVIDESPPTMVDSPTFVHKFELDLSVGQPMNSSLPNQASSPSPVEETEHVPITKLDATLAATDHDTSMDTPDVLGRGHQAKIPSTKIADYVVYTVSIPSAPSLRAFASQPSSCTVYPISDYHTCEHFSTNHRSFLAALTVAIEPRSYKEAMKDKVWHDALKRKIKALEDNHTWDLEELPPGKVVLGSMWIF